MARKGIWLLIACAVVVKISYVLAYAELPFLNGPIGDSTVYLAQAAAVRDGRFGDPVLLAFSPLYGYLLAALPNPGSMILLQLVLGTANLWLLYAAIEPRFGWRAALLSAAFYFGYGLVLFYETKILTETLGLSLALWATLVFLSDGFRRGRWAWSLGASVLVALAVFARASLVFGFPFFVVVALLPWMPAEGWSVRLKRATGVVVGASLLLGAYGVWTQVHAGAFVLVRYVTPNTSNLEHTTAGAWGDDLAAVGFRGPDALPNAWDVVDAVGKDLARRDTQTVEADAGPWEALAGIDVRGWIAGAPGKVRATLSDPERIFQYGYYAERKTLTPLQALPVTFHILLCFGVLGAYFLARDEGAAAIWPYVPWFFGCLVTVTLYHPSSRYRLGMIVPLCLLAGWGAVQLFTRARAARRWLGPAALTAYCLVSVARTMTYSLHHPENWELTQAASWVSQGAKKEVVRHTSRAIELAPDDPMVRRRAEYLRDASARTGERARPPAHDARESREQVPGTTPR